jgi:hypothetical protein
LTELMETLPWRAEPTLAKRLNATGGQLKFRFAKPGDLPTLLCALPRPASERVSVVFRVHSRAGIPLAVAEAVVAPGEHAFETTQVALLAMEGYSHVGHAERRRIETRVWSRRSFATASAI